jgi:hypothetical protein
MPVVKRSWTRIRQRLAVQVRQQGRGGFVVADVPARIHVAVAGAVLQRNAPLPAGRARGGARIGRDRVHAFAGHGQRAVARQPVRPVLVAGLQGLLDQQPAEARAVDEQFAIDALAAFQRHRFDEAVVGALVHLADLAFDALHAALLRQFAQEARVQGGVEVVGVGDVGQRRIRRRIPVAGREPALRRHHGLRRIVADRSRASGQVQLEPELVERQRPQRTADGAEAVDIAVADAAPVLELDAEFDRGLGALDELRFVDAQPLPVEQPDVRYAGLAHADDADFLGLDQADRRRPCRGRWRGPRRPSSRRCRHRRR